MPKKEKKNSPEKPGGKSPAEIVRELVILLRSSRNILRKQWVERMTDQGLLSGLTKDEVELESANIYDTCVKCLETGQYNDAEEYANRMAERGVLRGMSTDQILGGLLTLRDVYGRKLFEQYQKDFSRLLTALDTYEPVANKILSIVAMAFLEERERLVTRQQEAIRELSTPVLQLRPGLLILPIIGALDPIRARQLTEQLLHGIRNTRGKVVVIDVTGVPNVDSKVANHLIQTIDACRLMGAKVIVTGLTPEAAQSLVIIGIDVSRLIALTDLQSGIEEADRLLGFKLITNDTTVDD